MSTANFQAFSAQRSVFKIREVDENSWWVYRYEIGFHGVQAPIPRVVFFARDKQKAQTWIDVQIADQA